MGQSNLDIYSPLAPLPEGSCERIDVGLNEVAPLTLALSPGNGGEGKKKLELTPSPPFGGEGARRAGEGEICSYA